MNKCKICKKIIKGRSDKLYCSSSCKNEYHRKIKIVNTIATNKIDNILHRNRIILLEILGKNRKQIKILRIVLEKKKFRFKYHTHFYINSNNKMYYYIYDFAWMEFSNDEILIIKK